MRHVSTSLSLAGAAAALALIAATGVAPASSVGAAGANAANGVPASVELTARTAATKLAPTCRTVPTSVFAKILATSIVMSGPGGYNGPLTFFGKTIRVNGKVVTGSWVICGYDHNPSNPAGMGVSLSYLTESSSSRAVAIVKAMCAAMDTNSSYARVKLGSFACEQGHAGAMQSANGLLALDNVVVQLFGGQSPNETVALLHSIYPYVLKAKKVTPVVTVTSSTYAVVNGVIEVDLSCRGACSGDITISAPTSTGRVVIATTHYSMSASAPASFHLSLSPAGSNLLAGAGGVTLSVSLSVTVVNGATVNQQIPLGSGTPPSSTIPTTLPTTTAP